MALEGVDIRCVCRGAIAFRSEVRSPLVDILRGVLLQVAHSLNFRNRAA